MAVELRDITTFKQQREPVHSRQTLAEAAQTSKRTIERMEQGWSINLSTAKKIAAVLGLEVETFFLDANKERRTLKTHRPINDNQKIELLVSIALRLREDMKTHRQSVELLFQIVSELGSEKIKGKPTRKQDIDMMNPEDKITRLTKVGLNLRKNLDKYQDEIQKLFRVISSLAIEKS